MILNDLSSLQITDHKFLVLFFYLGILLKIFQEKSVRLGWVIFFSDKAIALSMIPRALRIRGQYH